MPAAPSHCVEGKTYPVSPCFSAVVVTQLMPGFNWMNQEFVGLEKNSYQNFHLYYLTFFSPFSRQERLRYSRHISHEAEHVFFINIHSSAYGILGLCSSFDVFSRHVLGCFPCSRFRLVGSWSLSFINQDLTLD